MPDITLRPFGAPDIPTVREVLVRAFEQTEEAELLDQFRRSPDWVPELTLVAEEEGRILGCIAYSRLGIGPAPIRNSPYLALAPVAVIPERQNEGIGGRLIRESLRLAAEAGYRGVVVLGHPGYYPRFGFRKAGHWGIRCPFPVPEASFMALELNPPGFRDRGEVVYSSAFDPLEDEEE